MVQAPKLPMDHIVAAFRLSPNDDTGTVAPASRVVSSHTRGLVKCMGGPAGAPVTGFSSLFSEARGGWSPLVAHPMPSGAGPGVRWANALGFVSRKYHSSPRYFGTLRSPCSSLCFLHTTKMWSRVWRGTPHSHRWDSSILNLWK